MKQKLISLLLSSALLTSACCLFTGCDGFSFGQKKHDHDWVIQEIVREKTCTQNGVISYSCSCGETKTKIKQTNGHKCSDWNILTEATCKLGGFRQGVCEICEEELSEDIPVSDHVYVNGVCKWCKATQSESNGNNSSNSSSNGNGSNSAQDNNNISSEGLEFTSNGDGTCYLSRVTAFKNKTVTIPSTFNGETVTGIGKDAFLELDSMETALTHISIPATVTSIADYAFFVIVCRCRQYCAYGNYREKYVSE